ncbi:hypothetical protein ABIB25_000077 [Nakamurella sp. UYEF19]
MTIEGISTIVNTVVALLPAPITTPARVRTLHRA